MAENSLPLGSVEIRIMGETLDNAAHQRRDRRMAALNQREIQENVGAERAHRLAQVQQLAGVPVFLAAFRIGLAR